jgi:hypothetical protein
VEHLDKEEKRRWGTIKEFEKGNEKIRTIEERENIF